MTRTIFDLQSTVKELHGIWVKDSLPNILRTIDPKSLKSAASLLERSKAKLMEFIIDKIETHLNEDFNSGMKTTDTYFKGKIKIVSDSINKAKESAQKWYDEMDWGRQKRLSGELRAAIISLSNFISQDKSGLLDELKNDLASLKRLQIIMSKYKEDKTEAANHYDRGGFRYLTGDADWVEPYDNVVELTRVFTSVTQFKPEDELRRLFTAIVEAEINGTIKALNESKNFIKTPKTKYNQGEQFGSGHGVRKDTHIPTLKSGKDKGSSVAEMRGDAVIDHYVNSK
jgi:hypothetical protein